MIIESRNNESLTVLPFSKSQLFFKVMILNANCPISLMNVESYPIISALFNVSLPSPCLSQVIELVLMVNFNLKQLSFSEVTAQLKT